MSTIYLTRGIQASGKSEYAKAWTGADPLNRIRVNRDDIRRMITGTADTRLPYELEQYVSKVENKMVAEALRTGRDVIIDAMHLKAAYVKRWYRFSDNVEIIDFPVDLHEALNRNRERGFPLPNGVIRDTYMRYTPKGVMPPIPERDPAPVITDDDKYVADTSLPSAVLVDIDGTLARMNGRSPYDMSRVGEDDVDENVAAIVNTIEQEHQVILMSGRSVEALEATISWLNDNSIRYDVLYVRSEGDTRADEIIKRELFDQHIRYRYNVAGVIDDRPKVCRMWRALGLTVFQVGDPAIEF